MTEGKDEMTKAQLEALRESIPTVTNLFANGDGSLGQRGWSDPSDNVDGSRLINWAEGIPPDYAMPYANGGKHILRKDINTIGNLATRELYLLQHGGYHTFNEKVAKAIGGYPYGAFLDWYQESTGWMRKVRCVKEGGNCFTPMDDPAHGVESQSPHWQIVDILDDEAKKSTEIKTKAVPPTSAYETMWGGHLLMRPNSELSTYRFSAGETVKTEPWVAPFDALVSFPMFLDRLVTEDGRIVSDIQASNIYTWENTNPYFYISSVTKKYDEYGIPYFVSFEGYNNVSIYFEVKDTSGDFLEVPCIKSNLSIFATDSEMPEKFRSYVENLYRYVYFYLKAGTSIRLCFRNDSTYEGLLSWFVALFNVKEVL